MGSFRQEQARLRSLPLVLRSLGPGGERLTGKPLSTRRSYLHELIGSGARASSAHFDSAPDLLKAAESMALEGIVSKRRDSSYQPGRSRDWIKVKTAAWRAANADRFEMFEKQS